MKDYIKKLVKDIKFFLKKTEKKSDNMVINDTKTYQEVKNKKLVQYRKKYYKMRKNAFL